MCIGKPKPNSVNNQVDALISATQQENLVYCSNTNKLYMQLTLILTLQ